LGLDVVSPYLKSHIVGSNAFNNSLERHSISEVEWSVDMETEVFIESLSLVFL